MGNLVRCYWKPPKKWWRCEYQVTLVNGRRYCKGDTPCEYQDITDPNCWCAQRTKDFEGLVLRAYQDSLGNWTIGIGHKITKNDTFLFNESKTINLIEADKIFAEDWAKAVKGAKSLSYWLEMHHLVKCVIIDMHFQMGHRGYKSFKKMETALKQRNYIEAAKELMDSRYAKQTPERAKENYELMMEAAKEEEQDD